MINSIISAIGNNNSIYPLLVRDCGIEVPTKVYKTYNQNKDDKEIAYLATRERILDEYATSAVWLGGIPLIGKIYGKLSKLGGYNSDINIKLIQAEEKIEKIDEQLKTCNNQEIREKLLNERAKLYTQSLSGNIERFSNITGAEKAVEDLQKAKLAQNKYKKILAGKFASEMVIPIMLMGFIIPKAVYALTASTRKKMEEKKLKNRSTKVQFEGVSFEKFKNNASKISFNGNLTSYLCNMNTVQKMAATDGGYAVGRVATARKKRGAVDIAFKMLGMLYLNFVAPKQIEKILSGISQKMFNIDVNLDPVILGDEEFKIQAANGNLKLPESNDIKDILNFIDNPENSKTLFVKYAKQLKKIKMLNEKIRDPRAYVDEEKLSVFRDNMANFQKELLKIKTTNSKSIAKKISNYVLKARSAKTFNILSNVALSSYLLACVLPDAQYLFREKVLGTKLEPDLL